MERDLKLKYRPQSYEEVVGQDEAVRLFLGPVMNAYLLHGHTGSGKTTLARIFAKVHNAELVEIDSSSIGKSEVLDLRETAKYKPITNSYKVIVLDEVHALSNQAWQSLLKIIEEAPKHTVWFLITTEIHKVPDTIKNRARSVPIKRISYKDIHERLVHIANQEVRPNVNEEKLIPIAIAAQGSMRLGIEYLQTWINTGELPEIKNTLDYIHLLNLVYGRTTEEFSEVISMTKDFTQDDIHILIQTISDIMIFLTMSTTRPKEDALEVLLEYTDIYLEDLDPLRYLMKHIHEKVDIPNLNSVINELYNLLHEIMFVYNKANDNRYTIRAVLTQKHNEWRAR